MDVPTFLDRPRFVLFVSRPRPRVSLSSVPAVLLAAQEMPTTFMHESSTGERHEVWAWAVAGRARCNGQRRSDDDLLVERHFLERSVVLDALLTTGELGASEDSLELTDVPRPHSGQARQSSPACGFAWSGERSCVGGGERTRSTTMIGVG